MHAWGRLELSRKLLQRGAPIGPSTRRYLPLSTVQGAVKPTPSHRR
jgi:hypothetical protein